MSQTFDAGVKNWRPHVDVASLRGRFWVRILQIFCTVLHWTAGTARNRPFDIARVRKQIIFFENMVANVPPDVRFEPVDDSPVAGDWVDVPSRRSERTLLYVHGGSFIMDRSDIHNALIGNICKQAGAEAFVPDYRLAPENPFPAGLEDVKTAYKWLLARGTDPARLAIVADSAGGGLALAALVALRDEGVEMPAAMTLLAPWVDMTLSGNSILGNLNVDPIVNSLEGLNICVRLYLQGHSPTDPLASPLFADLSSMPPTLLHVGAPDVLRDDTVRLADRLKDAGSDVWCDVYPRMPHVWHRLGPLLPETRRSIAEIGDFLEEMIPNVPDDIRGHG